nr:cyclic GMP-AMP synthase-like isoform X2 [Megalopta genalis]XP_033340255.1 cyclic GMP-AMP synthase-like isoform X2 [Megalopta genalis]XP_033340256.1 cyclic GMP-AMP synthase-like isoform X2 [Megalopta genalis]XP_033340257.1 cyclic GMP-AMP synthase-like isoform X2 [Megalopta genalis]
MDDPRLRRYLKDDRPLQLVERMFITLQMEEVKEANALLTEIINNLVDRMRMENSLFKKAYNKVVFCGSFYKGTKISEPNEFDINIVLNLHNVLHNDIQLDFIEPGFVRIRIIGSVSSRYILTEGEKRQLRRLIDNNNYLDPHKFRYWFESIISDFISKISSTYSSRSYEFVKTKKSGPAFTLLFKNYDYQREFSIDIVPVLTFDTRCVIGRTINSEFTNKEWFAVSISQKISSLPLWRQSYVYQENEILSLNGRIKQTIRLMKKLRDTHKWTSIASYFIETVFLNKLPDIKEILNTTSTTWLFYVMLKEMYRCFQQHTIKYFWDDEYNLLSRIKKAEMINITGRLQNIIKQIERNAPSDPFIVAKLILGQQEFELLMEEYYRKEFENMNINDDDQARNR